MSPNQFSSDVMLDKLQEMYMENRSNPQCVLRALDSIQEEVGHKTYLRIENNLSMIMDSLEVRAFKLGFKVGFKTVMEFSKETLFE